MKWWQNWSALLAIVLVCASRKTLRISISNAPPANKSELQYKKKSHYKQKWSKALKRNSSHICCIPEPLNVVHKDMFEKLKSYNAFQLFSLFFDVEVLQFILESTIKYVRFKSNTEFQLDIYELKRFHGFLVLTGYNTLPSTTDYYSSDPTLGVSIIKKRNQTSTFRAYKALYTFLR